MMCDRCHKNDAFATYGFSKDFDLCRNCGSEWEALIKNKVYQQKIAVYTEVGYDFIDKRLEEFVMAKQKKPFIFR